MTGSTSRVLRVGWLVVVAAIVGACTDEAPPPPPPPPSVQIAEVLQRDVPIYVENIGQTRGSTEIEIRARVEGILDGNTIYGAATVMEEVGLRGATTSVRAIHPDVAVIFESDIAGDVPGIKPEESSIKLGKGPTGLIYDVRMIPNLRLRDLVMDLAAQLSIPLQISTIEAGATDGGAIHLHDTGVSTVVVGVPARHIHSHSSIIHRDDYDHAVKLLSALMQRLDAETVRNLVED